LINTYIPKAHKAIETFCQRTFDAKTSQVEYVDGTGRDYFYAENYPIIKVNSLIDSYDQSKSAGLTTLTAGQYIIYSATGKIQLNPQGAATISVFTSDPQGIKIDYDYGYSTVPADIALACANLTALWTGLKNKTYISQDGQIVSTSVVAFDIPKEIQNILLPYQRTRIV
jgi:hypothetical protein